MFALRYALRNLRRNKLRSGVTLLGVSVLLFLVSLTGLALLVLRAERGGAPMRRQ